MNTKRTNLSTITDKTDFNFKINSSSPSHLNLNQMNSNQSNSQINSNVHSNVERIDRSLHERNLMQIQDSYSENSERTKNYIMKLNNNNKLKNTDYNTYINTNTNTDQQPLIQAIDLNNKPKEKEKEKEKGSQGK